MIPTSSAGSGALDKGMESGIKQNWKMPKAQWVWSSASFTMLLFFRRVYSIIFKSGFECEAKQENRRSSNVDHSHIFTFKI